MRRFPISEDERVLVFGMFEEIINAVLFHEPRHKGQVRLPVLHAIFEFRKGPARSIAKIGKSPVPENFFDNGRCLPLKDVAIARARQQPQPGPQGQSITEEIGLCAEPLRLHDTPLKIRSGFVVTFECQGTIFANCFVEIAAAPARSALRCGSRTAR